MTSVRSIVGPFDGMLYALIWVDRGTLYFSVYSTISSIGGHYYVAHLLRFPLCTVNLLQNLHMKWSPLLDRLESRRSSTFGSLTLTFAGVGSAFLRQKRHLLKLPLCTENSLQFLHMKWSPFMCKLGSRKSISLGSLTLIYAECGSDLLFVVAYWFFKLSHLFWGVDAWSDFFSPVLGLFWVSVDFLDCICK